MGNSNKPIKVYKKRTKKIRKDKRGTIPYKKRKYTKRKSTNKSNNKTSKKGGAGQVKSNSTLDEEWLELNKKYKDLLEELESTSLFRFFRRYQLEKQIKETKSKMQQIMKKKRKQLSSNLGFRRPNTTETRLG